MMAGLAIQILNSTPGIMQAFVQRFGEVNENFQEAVRVVRGDATPVQDEQAAPAQDQDQGMQVEQENGAVDGNGEMLPAPAGVLAAEPQHATKKRKKATAKTAFKVQAHTGNSTATAKRAAAPVKNFVQESVNKSSPSVAEHILKKVLQLVITMLSAMPSIGEDGVTETVWSTLYGNAHGGNHKFSGSSKPSLSAPQQLLDDRS